MSDPITLTEVPIAAAWNVQGDASRADFIDQMARQFPIDLPIAANTTVRAEALTAFWLGPRSWLLVAESVDSPLAHFIEKRNALNAAGGALFDLTASRIAYRLAGERATDVLATGCPLDLHPRAFRAASARKACSAAPTCFCIRWMKLRRSSSWSHAALRATCGRR